MTLELRDCRLGFIGKQAAGSLALVLPLAMFDPALDVRWIEFRTLSRLGRVADALRAWLGCKGEAANSVALALDFLRPVEELDRVLPESEDRVLPESEDEPELRRGLR